MNENIEALIEAIAAGNTVETQEMFNQIINQKIAIRLEEMRTDLTNKMFNKTDK